MSFQQSSYVVAEDAGPQPTLVTIIKEDDMVSEIDLSIQVQLRASSSATNGRYANGH